MRWIHLTIIIVFVAATFLFALQNLEMVTISFLEVGLRAPLALVTAIVYVLGAITGGSIYVLLRKSLQASRSSSA